MNAVYAIILDIGFLTTILGIVIIFSRLFKWAVIEDYLEDYYRRKK